MNNNEKKLCEIMLTSYGELENLCNDIDERVKREAIKSRGDNIQCKFNLISRLTYKKIALINIKVIIDEAMQELKNNDVIKMRYIYQQQAMAIQKKLKISLSTYFYKINKQKEKLYEIILSNHEFRELFEFIYVNDGLLFKYTNTGKTEESEQE